MKALQFEKPERIQRIEIPEPQAPGVGEALVTVHRVGVCGTDISGFLGKMPFFSYPRIPGHELGIEVTAVGAGVTNVHPGDCCSVEPYLNCQACSACRRGFTNCCENNQTLGVHCDGGLRPQFIVPARKLHPSRKLGFDELALVETLAIGCHAVHRGNPQKTESVLIIGAGPIGLSVIVFAKLAGANTIIMDINQQRLDFCKTAMGVNHTVLSKGGGSEIEEIKMCSPEANLPEVVIDATGSNKSMSNALNYCAFGGRLVYVGITQQEITFLHAPIMHRRELTLLASRNALPGDFTRIIGCIEKGQLNTKPWITHRSGFDELPERFASYTKPESGVIKAMIEIN